MTLYTLLSLGLNMQWGFTGLPNFGYHAFFGIGAYASAIITLNGFPPVIGFLAGLLISCSIALLLGTSTLKLRGDYFFIGSWVFGEVIWYFFHNELWLTGGPNGLPGVLYIGKTIPRLFSQIEGTVYSFAFLGILIVVLWVLYALLERIVNSPYGRVLKAMREDELVCKAVGKNIFRFRLECFLISAMIASVAGGFYAHYIRFVCSETLTSFITFYIMVCLLLGGLGSNKGAIIGAFIIQVMYEGLRFLGDLTGGIFATQLASIRILIIAIALVLIMEKRPQGILGSE